MTRPMAAIILAAGKGTRMKSAASKVMHHIGGRSLLGHVLATCRELSFQTAVVVSAPGGEDVRAIAEDAGAANAIQTEQLGTGHAVQSAKAALEGFEGDVVILYGDTPLIRPRTVERMFAAREKGADVVVLGFDAAAPAGYGRLMMDGDRLVRIVEAKDATEDELRNPFVNSGVMVVSAERLFALLGKVGNTNASGEYYLTDIVALANEEGLSCTAIACDEAEVLGVNSRADLAAAEAALQARLRQKALDGGATLVAPETVFFSFDTELAADVWVGPHVVFGTGVSVGEGTTIKSFSHLEGASIAPHADVGPFARLRPGAEIGTRARIGNFVEVKKARIEDGAKVNHLSYVGDARVGAGANVGAGVITCNYDGFDKHMTDIGEGAFIGSNSSLVAPVVVEAGAYVGSGSVITKKVSEDALGLTRPDYREIDGWAARFRARKQKEKSEK